MNIATFVGLVERFGGAPAIGVLVLSLLIAVIANKFGSINIFHNKSREKKRRTCGDVMINIMGMQEHYYHNMNHIENNILKSTMNYTEQKLVGIQLYVIGLFQSEIRTQDPLPHTNEIISQVAIFREALKNSMAAIKDEIRRSFKENGFVGISQIEFESYIKSKHLTLVSMGKSYMSTYYPDISTMVVNVPSVMHKFDDLKFEQLVFDIFNNARYIAAESYKKKEEVSLELRDKINSFIKNNLTCNVTSY